MLKTFLKNNRDLTVGCLGVLVFFFSRACFAEQSGKSDLKILADISHSYDDNITYVKENAVEDFVSRVTLGMDWNYEGKTSALEWLGRITQHIFAENADFNNSSQDFTCKLMKEFSGHDSVVINNTFVHAEEPSSFLDALGRETGRYSYVKNKLNFAYNRDVSKQFFIVARYAHDADFFSRKDIADSSMHSVGAKLEYKPNSTTMFSLSDDFSRRDFDPGSNASAHTLAAGIKQYFTKQLAFEGSGGVSFSKSYDHKKYNKPVMGFSFIDELSKNTITKVTFMKRYDANAYEEDLFSYSEFSADILRQISERWGGKLSLFYGKGRYISLGIKDTLQGLSAGLFYELRPNIKINVGYAYTQTNSNSDIREYKRNIYSLGCAWGF